MAILSERSQTDHLALAGVESEPSPGGRGEQAEQEGWDEAVRAAGGHFLQSWRWGEFKQRHGWETERVVAATPAGHVRAQLLFRRRGPFSLGYIPRGPVVGHADERTVAVLCEAIDERARRRRALGVLVEPNEVLPLTGWYKDWGFVRGPAHVQPSRTVKVLLLDDDALLAQMHQKTRYSVRLARRRGVVVERPPVNQQTLSLFYDVLSDTAERNVFGIHRRDYYDDFMRIFGDDALMLFARVEDAVAAVLIAAKFGDEAIYMYGGSSSVHRAHGASYYLQFAAMQWAREHGCQRYDLWGIPPEDPVSTQADGNRVAGTRGDDWRGLYKFKVGFGGEIVTLPPTLERRYRPLLAFAARRLTAVGGS